MNQKSLGSQPQFLMQHLIDGFRYQELQRHMAVWLQNGISRDQAYQYAAQAVRMEDARGSESRFVKEAFLEYQRLASSKSNNPFLLPSLATGAMNAAATGGASAALSLGGGSLSAAEATALAQFSNFWISSDNAAAMMNPYHHVGSATSQFVQQRNQPQLFIDDNTKTPISSCYPVPPSHPAPQQPPGATILPVKQPPPALNNTPPVANLSITLPPISIGCNAAPTIAAATKAITDIKKVFTNQITKPPDVSDNDWLKQVYEYSQLLADSIAQPGEEGAALRWMQYTIPTKLSEFYSEIDRLRKLKAAAAAASNRDNKAPPLKLEGLAREKVSTVTSLALNLAENEKNTSNNNVSVKSRFDVCDGTAKKRHRSMSPLSADSSDDNHSTKSHKSHKTPISRNSDTKRSRLNTDQSLSPVSSTSDSETETRAVPTTTHSRRKVKRVTTNAKLVNAGSTFNLGSNNDPKFLKSFTGAAPNVFGADATQVMPRFKNKTWVPEFSVTNSVEEVTKREDRKNRFREHLSVASSTVVRGDISNNPLLSDETSTTSQDTASRTKDPLVTAEGLSRLSWFEKLAKLSSTQKIVGLSAAKEKSYLRLCGPPDPALIRSPESLEESFFYVLDTFFACDNPSYSYIDEQMRSIRQDFVVQAIKSPFLAVVYSVNARLALSFHDLGQFNQCQSQLRYLEREVPEARSSEFLGYRLLYAAINQLHAEEREIRMSLTAADLEKFGIQYALTVRQVLLEENYRRYFKLTSLHLMNRKASKKTNKLKPRKSGQLSPENLTNLERKAELKALESLVIKFREEYKAYRASHPGAAVPSTIWTGIVDPPDEHPLVKYGGSFVNSTLGDSFSKHFSLVTRSPLYSRALLRIFEQKFRMQYLVALAHGHYELVVSRASRLLGFLSEDAFVEFLVSCKTTWASSSSSADKKTIDCRNSLAAYTASPLLLSKKLKAMG